MSSEDYRDMYSRLSPGFDNDTPGLNEETVLPGEDEPTPASTDLPVRWMICFVLLDAITGKKLPLDVMLHHDSDASPIAYGLVQPAGVMDEDEDDELDEDDTFYWMKTGSILREWQDLEDPHGHIWIQTSHAWYILEEPDPEYHDMFQQALRPHALLTRLLHVVRQDPAVDLHTIDWATVLPHPALADIHSYDFCSDDNLEAELRDIVESSEQDYDDWPARIHRILGTSKGSRGKGRQIRPDRLPKSAKARTFTATPLVAHIVKDYFAEGELNEIQMPGMGEDHHERAPASAPVAHPRSSELKVIIPRVRDSDALQWISIGGVKYMPKDSVRYQDTNGFGCAIVDFILRSSPACYSIKLRQLLPSSDTILGEMGDPRELFWTNTLFKVQPKQLLSKITIDQLCGLQDPTAPYICRMMYDKHTLTFVSFEYSSNSVPDMAPHRLNPQDSSAVLRTLDLFSGTGGLSHALAEETHGRVEVAHAIDVNVNAALTLKSNFDDTQMHHQDVNDALERAVLAQQQQQLPDKSALNSSIDKKMPLPPPITRPIDIIVGGFPCQGHSGLNRFKRHNDSRNPLLIPQLSWVELLQPRFCIFENVPRFLATSLTVKQGEDSGQSIEHGYLKLLLRCLVSLGYQCRFSVLQAAHYGAPQTRQRFIIIAAKLGSRLPNLPTPTHHSSRHCLSLSKLLGLVDTHNSSIPKPLHELQAEVSVGNTIKDLPRFDWSRDHIRGDVIPDASTDEFPQHFTSFYSQRLMKNTVAVPFHAGASLSDVCPHAVEGNLDAYAVNKGHGKRNAPRKSYVRLGWHGQFRTIVTNISPEALSSHVLHPRCKRVLTVRELARAQGFPDDFMFKTEYGENLRRETHRQHAKEIHRLLGNAVPWALARALGRELNKVLVFEDGTSKEHPINVDSGVE